MVRVKESQSLAVRAWGRRVYLRVGCRAETVYKVKRCIKSDDGGPAPIENAERRTVIPGIEQLPVRLILGSVLC